MTLARTLALLVAVGGCVLGQAPPDAAERKAILERLKDAAVNYSERLQDFLCVELVKRSKEDGAILKHWQDLDTQTREVSYVSHQEHFRVLDVNGKPPSPANQIKPGYFLPSGEFGLALGFIFDPKNEAAFEWDHVEQSGSQRLCVFRYRVTAPHGTMSLSANGDRANLHHHGLVYAECASALPMRIQIDTEPGSTKQNGSKIALGWKIDVRYAMTPIAGHEFLLPQASEETVRFGGSQTKVAIEFRDYRKYDSSSTVRFVDN